MSSNSGHRPSPKDSPKGSPKNSHRSERVADLIREEIAKFLINGVKNPQIGFVTITQVKITPDLHIARVYYTAYGTGKEQQETAEGLLESSKRIRSHLAKTVKMRTVPRLEFFVDEGLEHSYKIQKLLNTIIPSSDEKE